jgi:hypothetical protein
MNYVIPDRIRKIVDTLVVELEHDEIAIELMTQMANLAVTAPNFTTFIGLPKGMKFHFELRRPPSAPPGTLERFHEQA